jgi:hypothetical protein
MKTHRLLPDIPTDPDERRKQIKWVMDHPLWMHSYFVPVPPDGVATFLADGWPDSKDWPLKDVGDGGFRERVDLAVVFVDPTTEMIEDDDSRNTDLRVEVEAGGWCDLSLDPSVVGGNIPEEGWTEHNKWIGCHDTRLDCGGETIEEALLELARLVKFFYQDNGNEKEDAPVSCEGSFKNWGEKDEKYISGHTPDESGFCLKCGFEIQLS